MHAHMEEQRAVSRNCVVLAATALGRGVSSVTTPVRRLGRWRGVECYVIRLAGCQAIQHRYVSGVSGVTTSLRRQGVERYNNTRSAGCRALQQH